jgi:transcription initiation factor TFIID subunit 2
MSILKDPTFFYRVRMEVAYSLIKFDTAELEQIGLTHLTKYLRDYYIMPGTNYIPKRNDFEDLQEYFIRCAIVTAIAKYRDNKGWSPTLVRSILINLLRYNDNTGNKVRRIH